uniref:Uncharacterized protein n=1 Tax=Strigamia maritima TaxID=126957 RepID=T1JL72_STRMM
MNRQNFNNVYETVWRLICLEGRKNTVVAASNTIQRIDERTNPYPTPRGFNFMKQDIRYAYYYCFFTIDTYAIKECWHLFHILSFYNLQEWKQSNVITWLNNIITTQNANLVCLGGGAGYEIVGFCKWLKTVNAKIKLHPFIVDKYRWASDTQRLLEIFDSQNEYNLRETRYTTYSSLLDMIACNNELMDRLRSADLVTVAKFISALDSNEKEYTVPRGICGTKLLKAMKPGALVFFMDNIGAENLNQMRIAAETAELKCIAELIHRRTETIPQHEIEGIQINNFITALPLLSTDVCAALWQKQ